MGLPDLTAEDVVAIVRKLYGLKVISHWKLNSTDDINIHVLVDGSSENPAIPVVSKEGYVLKILNSIDSKKVDFIGAMHAAIECSINQGIVTPRPLQNLAGSFWSTETLTTASNDDEKYLVRLFTYIPGEVLLGKQITPTMSRQMGQFAAKLDTALLALDHPALFGHKRHWSLTEVVNVGEKIECIDDEKDRQLVLDVVNEFKQNVASNYSRLQTGVIHADLNYENFIIQRPERQNNNTDFTLHGVLDFGDMVHEYHVFEVAILTMYLLGEETSVDPFDAAGHLLAGYLTKFRLPAFDLHVLKECICGRFAQSLVYGAYTHKQDPSNTYVLGTAKRGWNMLRKLWSIPKHELYSKWRSVLHTYGLELETSEF